MSVTDFECAIAKAQIGRYIAGDNLAPEIARQLETHINNCARCKLLLQEKKNSLEAMVLQSETHENQTSISINESPIPMTSGSSALKPDYMEALADSARESLKAKIRETTQAHEIGTEPSQEELASVAPAFAHHSVSTVDSVPTPEAVVEAAPKKRGFSLASLALYKNIPDDATTPSLSVENIRSAKAVFRDNNQSMRKPAMYMAGLCCVVAAMSFILRDPTTLFGGRLSDKNAVASTKSKSSDSKTKSSTKPRTTLAKVVPHKPIQLNDRGTDAATFAEEPATGATAKSTTKVTVKPKATAATTSANAKPNEPPVTKTTKPSTPKQATSTTSHSLSTTKPEVKKHVKRKAKQASSSNTVKLYAPETTPNNPENQK